MVHLNKKRAIKNIEGQCLKSIFLKKLNYYDVKCSDKDGPWRSASSIPRTYLALSYYRIREIWFSFEEGYHVTFMVDEQKLMMQIKKSECNDKTESLDFTYDHPPVIGLETIRIDNHVCCGDFLTDIKMIENEKGLIGYSLRFTCQDMIYICPKEDFLLFKSEMPVGFWERHI